MTDVNSKRKWPMNTEEWWKIIPDCPNYQISNLGRVYNTRLDRFLVGGLTKGHSIVNLINRDEIKITRSVAQLVASAFVDPPYLPDHKSKRHQCTSVIVLDGDLKNLSADNLAWRPRWIAWQYRKQLTEPQPIDYQRFPVINLRTGIEYSSVIEAGMSLGLLFKEIWKSVYMERVIFPYWDKFAILEDV